ncbi:MAG: PCMD domain-containing protein [Parabacteroides sp.]|nr:PCMD domain-containing protein [Parabacteroides sp.]
MKPAGSPNVFQNLDFPEIVEGDAMKEDITAQLIAGNGIKEAMLTIACSSPQANEIYSLESDEHKQTLLSVYGIQVQKDAESKIVITYPKEFSTHLAAPENGEAMYSFKYFLKDKNDKVEELEKKMTVKAPVFNLLTGDGDAFARRIMLRVDMPVGDENKLSFEYKGGDVTDWTAVESPGLTKMKDEDNIYMGVLKELTPEVSYTVRAIYNNDKRIGEKESEVTTEKEMALQNGNFEASWVDKTISGLLNGADLFKNVSLTSNDPEGWATVNSKTFADKSNISSTYNTVPSTLKVEGVSGNGVRLRTVGWDNGAGNSGLNHNHVAAGKLFLGTYS